MYLSSGWARTTSAGVIAGATRPEQIVANAAAAGWELSPEEMAQIDTILEPKS
jgi:aryl-alcohol dehydrogenase-like predicted oxidoreductase